MNTSTAEKLHKAITSVSHEIKLPISGTQHLHACKKSQQMTNKRMINGYVMLNVFAKK